MTHIKVAILDSEFAPSDREREVFEHLGAVVEIHHRRSPDDVMAAAASPPKHVISPVGSAVAENVPTSRPTA